MIYQVITKIASKLKVQVCLDNGFKAETYQVVNLQNKNKPEKLVLYLLSTWEQNQDS